MPRVVHFEIHADDPERAIKFYADLFGWTFQRFGEFPYWLVTTGPDSEPGINGGLMPRSKPNVGDAITAYVCSVNVAEIDKAMEQVPRFGGTITSAKTPIPGVGWSAYALDTEGNNFGLYQDDPKAA